MEICIITKQNTNFIWSGQTFGLSRLSFDRRVSENQTYNIKIIIVTYFMLLIQKYCYYSYIEFCDSMVFWIDPRSRLKSELTLSEMRLVLVTSRSAIIFFWLMKPLNTYVGEYLLNSDSTLLF